MLVSTPFSWALVGAGADRIAARRRPFGGRARRRGLGRHGSDVEIHVQAERRGTAHAVLAASAALETRPGRHSRDLRRRAVASRRNPARQPRAVQPRGRARRARPARPPITEDYGRLVEHDGMLVAIREQKDASEAERAIRRCNAGPLAISSTRALRCSKPCATTTPRASSICPMSSRSPETRGARRHSADRRAGRGHGA